MKNSNRYRYKIKQRVLMFILIGELVISAFGIKAVGEAAIGSVKGLFTSKPSPTPILKGGCFLAGTLVSRYCTDTIDHREFIAIENIKSGDLVWACNPRIGIWEPKIVLGTTSLLYEGDIIKITVNGSVVRLRIHHFFYKF